MSQIINPLNEQQQKAAYYQGAARCLLVMAGAGCGKTKTIMERIKFNILNGVEPERILAITFTNRSAKEMKERLKAEISSKASSVVIGTFHEFCLKVLKAMPKSFDVSGFTILDSEDQLSLIKKSYKKIIPDDIKKVFLSHDEVLKMYSYCRNCKLEISSYVYKNTSYDENLATLFLEVIEDYQNEKNKNGYIDFDDILEIFNDTLSKKPELCADLCSVFHEVLVDEMQDTNPLQMDLLKKFAKNNVRLFCVGDPAQSIYKFRGAEFKHVYNFERLLESTEVIKLNKNYRSTQKILDFSNWILSNSYYDYNNNLEAAKEDSSSSSPMVQTFYTVQEEVSWISKQIIKRAESKKPLSDCLVLVRTMADGGQIELDFIKNGIPYVIIGGMSITKLAHIKDVMATVKAIFSNKDELAWTRFLCLMPKIGSKSAQKIIQEVHKFESRDDVLRYFYSNKLTSEVVANIYKHCSEQISSPMKLVSSIVSILSQVIENKYDKWNIRKKELETLVIAAGKYSDVSSFVADFTLEPKSVSALGFDHADGSSLGAVTISTVHGAKGTEAEIVYVAMAGPGKYPHIQSVGNIEDEEEERRILYVAVTRAKKELCITRNMQTRYFDIDSIPSEGEPYFLSHLPKNVIEINRGATFKKNVISLNSLRDHY